MTRLDQSRTSENICWIVRDDYSQLGAMRLVDYLSSHNQRSLVELLLGIQIKLHLRKLLGRVVQSLVKVTQG